MDYTRDIFAYHRRTTTSVNVGDIVIGSSAPVRVQSMGNTSTNDIPASLAQCERLVAAGAELVRFTTQGIKEADNLAAIHQQLLAKGIRTPLVADVHFNPAVADHVAPFVDKVRINPGNYVDSIHTFRHLEYTDEEYSREIDKIRTRLIPFLDICRAHGTAIRIGVNHGSLSDRIMSRYGDTPQGMVESCMEFLRICKEQAFHNVVISIKSSNTVVMIQTVRLLVATMQKEEMHYPLHIGVTEAGDAEDGRIKSAVGIGTLLLDGIGDTIRVSLTEDPEKEIPVARKLVEITAARAHEKTVDGKVYEGFNPFEYHRRSTTAIDRIGGSHHPIVVGADYTLDEINALGIPIHSVEGLNASRAYFHSLVNSGDHTPVILLYENNEADVEKFMLAASAYLGALLVDGFGDGLLLRNHHLSTAQLTQLSFGILQATRLRISKTEYIACPGCGRTMFNLQNTLAKVKAATSELKNLKIAVMGCIVNGTGEMADADYGYVGAGKGKVSLYKGKDCIEKNISEEEAIEHLVRLIRQNGDWTTE